MTMANNAFSDKCSDFNTTSCFYAENQQYISLAAHMQPQV